MAAILEINDVTKIYPSGVRANERISLTASEGEIFGLLGPNGAGKTTLVSQVLGLLSPTSGTIRIGGGDVTLDPAEARRACSYQAQTTSPIEGLTPLQAIEIVGRIRGGAKKEVRARARALVGALQIDEWASKFVPLSGGVARLTSFCMAAVKPGRIVVLDEPTNDVDPLRRKLLWQQIRSLADSGPAVLLVTHNVLEAERCVDRLAVIDDGHVLAQGTQDSLKSGLGGLMRLEIVLEPDIAAPSAPRFVVNPTVSGRRLIGDISLADAGSALQWSQEQKDAGQVAEFSIGPASLEDIYVRLVDASNGHAHELAS